MLVFLFFYQFLCREINLLFKTFYVRNSHALQNSICQRIHTTVLPDNEQMKSLTEPASPAPTMPLSPDVPSTMNSQIEPTGSPHLTSIDEALSCLWLLLNLLPQGVKGHLQKH